MTELAAAMIEAIQEGGTTEDIANRCSGLVESMEWPWQPIGATAVSASVAAIAEVDTIRIAAKPLPEPVAILIVMQAAVQRGLIDPDRIGHR